VSNTERATATASAADSASVTVSVCVPRRGHSDVSVTADGSSTIPGDLSSNAASAVTRQGSIQLRDISVSDDIGPACTPG
jgi:hypothetical protein